jgi:serine/threonine-protein kinase RsbW
MSSTLFVNSNFESVNVAVEEVTAVILSFAESDDFVRDVRLVVSELVSNAVKHGNKFDETKQIRIVFEADATSLRFSITDEGAGFCLADVMCPMNPERLLCETGRGLFMVRQLVDVLRQDGSTVEIVKIWPKGKKE